MSDLIGKAFVHLDEEGEADYAGEIVGRVDAENYLLELIEWLDYKPDGELKIITLEELKEGRLFSDTETLLEAVAE